MVLFSHPTGNANVRAALEGLLDGGMLGEFHTSIAAYPGNLWNWLGREFQRRRYDGRLQSLTVQHPKRELGRLAASRLEWFRLTQQETGPFCIDAVYRSIDCSVACRLRAKPQGLTGVYSYEDGAVASLTAARELGLLGFYDLPIGYWRAARRLLEDEHQRWPEWSATLTGFRDSPAKLARKDDELRLADQIFVASSFTKKTLQDHPDKLAPVHIIPYGFPGVGTGRAYDANGKRPLKLLFVGGLSQRKGIADLFAAVAAIGPRVELTIVGGKSVQGCAALDDALTRHRWIPSLPHAKILDLMGEHDVFVFPSLFEGFGLVITEAMSQGTPVITTDRTAGPDLIEHGRNGWLIEAGNTEALQFQIEELLAHPSWISSAGREAMDTARQRPWKVYGRELAGAVERVLQQRTYF